MPSLRPVERNEYKTLYAHMKRDFPAGELAPYFVIQQNLKRGAHSAHWLTDDGRDVAYIIETAHDDMPFVLLNYLAVLPDVRQGGYGSALLDQVSRIYPGRSMVVEVEDPAAAKDDTALSVCARRIRFYERAGYNIVPVRHFKLFGVQMLVMIQGDRRPQSVRKMIHALYRPTFTAPLFLRMVDIEDEP